MTTRAMWLAIFVSLVAAAPKAEAEVKFEFLQSYEVESPASAGFKRGIMLNGPMALSEWPTDLIPSVPTSRIAKTRLGMEYSKRIAYPAYVGWVRIGNAVACLCVAGIGLAVYLGRGVRKHA